MTTFTSGLRLTVQVIGENAETWGDVVNAGVHQLLEDAVSGIQTVSLNAGSVTLTANNGAADQARSMILDLTGALAASRTVTVPTVSKVYVVRNSTTGSQTITIKTAAGSGFVIADSETQFLFCDGVDIFGLAVGTATTAVTATTATTATNATQLGGIVAALYARLDVGGTTQNFSKAQTVLRVSLTPGVTVAVDAAASNSFVLIPVQNFTLSNPINPSDGQTIRVMIKQDAVGSRIITWGSKYKFAGGVQPILTTGVNLIDYFSFEYYAADTIWIGGGLLDLK